MLLSNIFSSGFIKSYRLVLSLGFALFLSACQFQPLHGTQSTQNGSSELAAVEVGQAYSRVGQQVRNHLIFLFTGGNTTPEKTHEVRLRVNYNNNVLASINDPNFQDTTAGTVTVTVSYDLIDKATGKSVARGSRQAIASYDRTGQVFANERAERDAENRAAKEAAESIRLAVASDFKRV